MKQWARIDSPIWRRLRQGTRVLISSGGTSCEDRQATRESAVDVEVRNPAFKRHHGEGPKMEAERALLREGTGTHALVLGYTASQVSML